MEDERPAPTQRRYAGELLTAEEVANILKMAPGTIRRWAMAGTFDSIKIGPAGKRQTLRIRGESVDKMLSTE